ncbi:hypothetical protein [Gluconacetobacter diazotrophicus]|nr:hypothetical protein [Gluconacetobacter diazotrophicus]
MMFRVAIRKAALSLLGTGMALLAVGTTSAHAQHMVTDIEAGRLTLDALTAPPPPVRHIVYRRAVRTAPVHAYRTALASGTHGLGTHGLVRNVVYHPAHAASSGRHVAHKGRHRT